MITADHIKRAEAANDELEKVALLGAIGRGVWGATKAYGRVGKSILTYGKTNPFDAAFAGATMLAMTPVIGGVFGGARKFLNPYSHLGSGMKPVGVTFPQGVTGPTGPGASSRFMVGHRKPGLVGGPAFKRHSFAEPKVFYGSKARQEKSFGKKHIADMMAYDRPGEAAAKKSMKKTGGALVGRNTVFTEGDIKRAKMLRKNLEKTASAGAFRRVLGEGAESVKQMGPLARQMLLYSAFGAAMGAGGPLAMYGIGKVVKSSRKGTQNRDYKKVLRADPSLKKEDDAKKFYGILHRTSPYIAKEPEVAAKVVRHMIDLPEVTPNSFRDILQLERGLQETEMPFFRHSAKTSFNPAHIAGMPDLG